MSEIKSFKDPQGNVLAKAAIPDNYQIGASIVDKIQHERVPFFITAHAVDAARKAAIYAVTDELFTTIRNQIFKQTIKMVPNYILSSYRDYIEPEVYLQQFAEAFVQARLTPAAMADLPSIIGRNINQAYQNMMNEYQGYFDAEARAGAPTYANNTIMKSVMVKYTGTAKSGVPCVVIAGMDYKGIEYYTTASIQSVLGPLAGGLFAKKNKSQESSKKFGSGSPCDAFDWGAANRFVLITPPEYEADVINDFLEFVQTFHMEENLRQRFYQRIAERANFMYMQSMQYQQMAQQSAQNLMANQQRLAQTLAANSAAMSAGIMDSWNQKMASDSRISQARSEATLGVNTYQNSYGQNVSVSVTADHVYQNQYGDVYGVSGNAPDQEFLNKVSWTELHKK